MMQFNAMTSLMATLGESPVELTHLVLLLGVALILAGVMMSIRKRRQRGASKLTGREQLERYRQKDAVRDDMTQLMVEIEQLARRLGSQLDAKSMRIERLLEQTEQRIEQLQTLHDRMAIDRKNTQPTDADQPNSTNRGQPSAQTADHAQAAGSSRDANLANQPGASHPNTNPQQPDSAAGSGTDARNRTVDGSHDTPGDDQAINAAVGELADQGLTAQQIADRLDEHVGKVELILALRQAG